MDEETSFQSDEPMREEIASSEPREETVSEVTETEEIISEAEDERLAFPTARVVRILRQEIRSGKQIRSEVKCAANDWMGNTLRRVAREMDQSPYGSIGLADFNRAVRPFEMIDHLVKDQERIMVAIDKLKHDADQIKRDLLRFYSNLTGQEQAEE